MNESQGMPMDRRTFLKRVGQAAAVAAASGVAPAGAETAVKRTTVAAVGDCIISQRVSGSKDPDFLAVVDLLRNTDCVWGNCELVLGEARDLYPAPKGTDPHTISPSWAADEIAWTGIRFVGTANNHILDFGNEGLFATLENLKRVGIVQAGSGADLAHASRPAYIDTPGGGRVGQVNCASTFLHYFAAGPAHPYLRGRPGLNPLHIEEKFQVDRKLFADLQKAGKVIDELSGWSDPDMQKWAEQTFGKPPEDRMNMSDLTIVPGDRIDYLPAAVPGDVKRITEAVKIAHNSSSLVLATLHAHEARLRPELSAPFIEPLARAAIDAGADAFFAAGPHLLRGIEIYKGKPIFYSLGNFFFQLAALEIVPAESLAAWGLDAHTIDSSELTRKIPYNDFERYWQSVLPRITYEGNRAVEITLHPLALGFGKPLYERGLPTIARGEKAVEILTGLAALSKPFGTTITIEDGVGRIVLG